MSDNASFLMDSTDCIDICPVGGYQFLLGTTKKPELFLDRRAVVYGRGHGFSLLFCHVIDPGQIARDSL